MLEIRGRRDLLQEAFSPKHRREFEAQHVDRHLTPANLSQKIRDTLDLTE